MWNKMLCESESLCSKHTAPFMLKGLNRNKMYEKPQNAGEQNYSSTARWVSDLYSCRYYLYKSFKSLL